MAKSKTSRNKRRQFDDELTGASNPKPVRRGKSAELKAREHWDRSQHKPLTCITDAQSRYLDAIKNNDLTFGIGPAGTGKTYVAIKYAALEIDAGHYDGIIITRPIVEAGGGLGFLPGEVGDKVAPWRAPIEDVLREHYGQSQMEAKFNGAHPSISFIPLEHIRGLTFDNKIVILDEAQNTTPLQMKTLLTRMGKNSKLICDGDIDQVDIKGKSGLTDALEKLQGLASVGIAVFTEDDIIRSGLVRAILTRYRSYENASVALKNKR